MKKVLATTMATLLFGISFPVNTFALPNNPEGMGNLPNGPSGHLDLKHPNIKTENITLTANIKEISNQAPDGGSNQGPKQEKTIAERITKNNLIPVDISVWQDDPINWKDGVELDTSVNDQDLKKAFEEATFTSDGKDSKNPNLKKENDKSGVEVKIKVTFKDDSSIEVSGKKLYVFPHVTASTYSNLPSDAVKINLFLGEGTKVIEGNVTTEGTAEPPKVYKTYKVKPGTDLSKYILPTNKSFIENINLQPLDDSYINPRWEQNDFVVTDKNKEFTAKATKRYRVTFEFQGLDLDTKKDVDRGSLAKALKDKMPEADWVERGNNYNPVKPDNFTEIIKDDGGQVTKIYEWTFAGWNPTGIPSASKDEKLNGTWKRAQATSTEPTVEKITESDKVIKGQGEVGATIKVTLEDNTSLETTVGPDKKWEVKITKDLKKDEKVSVTQTEMGKKESAKKEVVVAEKAKENNKPLPNPDKKDKGNQSGSNSSGLRSKNHTSKTTKVETQVENKKQNNLENNSNKEEARHIIDVMSGNYQVIKDGVRQNRKMDVLPVIKNNRLMLPLRNLAEMIGAKVEWNQQTRTAIFTNKDLVAKIQIDGNEIVLSNGKVIKMDSKPLNINGRILLSVSNVANVFGLTNGNNKDGIDQNIEWDGDNKTVEINLNK